MKYDRALLEEAVRTYKKITNRNFVLVSELSKKQIANAVKYIDKHTKPENIVALLDNTLFSSGKGGIILTLEKIDCSDSVLSAAYFEKFIRAEASGDKLTVCYEENRSRTIKIKIYAEETASLLNTIVKLRDEAAKAAPAKTETVKAAEPKPAPQEKARKTEAAEANNPTQEELNRRYSAIIKMIQEKEEMDGILESSMPRNQSPEELYLRGKELDRTYNWKEAFECYKEAAKKGHVDAMVKAAKMILIGRAGEGMEELAVDYIEEALTYYNPEAEEIERDYSSVINRIREKRGTISVFDKAMLDKERGLYASAAEGFKKSAEAGNVEAMYELGVLAESGKNGGRDISEAIFWLEKAKKKGFTKGNVLLEKLYKENDEKEIKELTKRLDEERKNKDEYSLCFEKATEGDTGFMLRIADICEKIGKTSYSEDGFKEAFFWTAMAAEDGNYMAVNKLGKMFEEGIGVPIHFGKAIEWYKKSSLPVCEYSDLEEDVAGGVIEVVPDPDWIDEFLSECMLEGEGNYELGFSFDEKFKGLIYLFLAAEFDEPTAQYYIGEIYCEGFIFIKPDLAKAKYWLKKSANNGNREAFELLNKIR